MKLSKKTKIMLAIAFLWTWLGWMGAYAFSRYNGQTLSTEVTFIQLWTEIWGSKRFVQQLIFALAVYGPFVGFIMTTGFGKLKQKSAKNLWHYVVLIPVLSAVPVVVLSFGASFLEPKIATASSLTIAIISYFISNLVTSGTEEFGWRGVLYPDMKAQGMSFWDIAWKGGFIWAIWHYPLMVMMYLPLGVAVLIPSLIGFTAAIVAMNYITNFIYEKTENIWTVVVLHALNNTMSFAVILLFPKTPFTILTSIMSWVIVWWIEKKHINNKK